MFQPLAQVQRGRRGLQQSAVPSGRHAALLADDPARGRPRFPHRPRIRGALARCLLLS